MCIIDSAPEYRLAILLAKYSSEGVDALAGAIGARAARSRNTQPPIKPQGISKGSNIKGIKVNWGQATTFINDRFEALQKSVGQLPKNKLAYDGPDMNYKSSTQKPLEPTKNQIEVRKYYPGTEPENSASGSTSGKNKNSSGVGTGDVIDQRAKNAGLDLSAKPSPYKQLGNKTKKKLENKVNNRTITKEEWKRLEWNKRLASRRDAGVKEFWQQEKRRIIKGEPTTRNWSQEQKEAILSNKVPTYNGNPITGHHAYSVSKYPHIANRGEIIYPATVKEHLTRWHGGSYRRSLPGKPYNSSFPEEF